MTSRLVRNWTHNKKGQNLDLLHLLSQIYQIWESGKIPRLHLQPRKGDKNVQHIYGLDLTILSVGVSSSSSH